MSEPARTSEDDGILRLVRELCVSLDAEFLSVGVTWMGNLGHVLNLPSDECAFVTKGPRRGFVLLPVELKGRLDLDDWRPLIVSGIFFQLRPEIRRIWATSRMLVYLGMILAIGVPIAIIAVSPTFFHSLSFGLVLIILTPTYFLLPRIHNRWVASRLRLKADRRGAEVVGRDRMIRTLVKIDGFHILDLEERKRKKESIWQRRVFPFPTILDRLENLRNLPNA